MDPALLRSDLGGLDAPDVPESILPGAIIPVLLNKKDSEKLYSA